MKVLLRGGVGSSGSAGKGSMIEVESAKGSEGKNKVVP